ncbi:MAG: TauD/TfdA family dioxygenase [Cyanobacteriota bacterium]|nr:TauD/TfdA family dioxygenase [Cyanobacteriota bacterium]
MQLLSNLSVHKLKPFGAKLTNVDIDSQEHRDRIRELLYENGVLIIPGDAARNGAREIHADESLLELARLFGKLENYHPVNKSKDSAGRVQILETMGDTGIPADSFLFHSDISWRVNPSCASVLCAKILPPSGGDTCFQNANHMYQRLSPELKERLHNISGIHSLKEGYSRVNRPDDVKSDIVSIHPAAIEHPETGVPILYLNENFTVGLVGMSEEESNALLERVFSEASSPEYILSHSWKLNDVVIWDNYGVQHLAKADYQGLRRMHRVVAHNPHLRTEPYVGNAGQVEQADRYNEARNPFGVQEILGFIRAGDAVLDAGCGTGQHVQHLAQVANRVVGLDTDSARVAIAQERYRHLDNASFKVGSVTKLPFEDSSFDVLLLAQVLHHLGGDGVHAEDILREQCKQALVEAKRVLRRGGRVVLVTTSREQRRAAYWHFNLFPKTAWERLDAIWSLTEGPWFASLMQQQGFVKVGSATPSESHWVEVEDEQMVAQCLDPGWRSTDAAFGLLTPTELKQFVARVEAVLADGSARDLLDAALAGRASHGEATVYAYEIE